MEDEGFQVTTAVDGEDGWAKAQELRHAIAEASSRGRETVAFLEVESFSANLEYYVASAAQKVFVSPAARVPIREDPPTVRALEATVSIGEEIPPDQYKAVAAAIRFAEAMRVKAKARGL